MIYFWSDPHFFHRNVIKHCQRPFKDVEEMHAKLIENYNKVVGPDDICIWVGDCFFASASKAKTIMDQLNGKKICVLGNHDKGIENAMNVGFAWACYEMWLLIAGERVQIKHYPFNPPWWKVLLLRLRGIKLRYAERRPKDTGQFLIHGHTHQKDTFRGRAIHVGVDSNRFRPIGINEIEKYIKALTPKERKDGHSKNTERGPED